MAEYITRFEDGAGNYHYPITKAEAVEFGDQTVAEVLDAQKKASNRNLLHNWDWQLPVNQRGHSGAVSDAYCIDRWIGNGTVTPVGATYTTLANGTSMKQRIEAGFTAFMSRQFTISIEDVDGNIESGTAYWPVGTGATRSLILSSYTVVFRNTDQQYTIGNGITRYIPEVTITATVEKNIRAVKLEQGDKSTLELDTAADYGEQLATCQRYYHVLGTQDAEGGSTADITYCNGFITSDSKIIYASADLTVPMRTTPTLENVKLVRGTNSGGSYYQTRGIKGYLAWLNTAVTVSVRTVVGSHIEFAFEKTTAFSNLSDGTNAPNNTPVICGVTGALSADL